VKDVFGQIPRFWIARIETLAQFKVGAALLTFCDKNGHCTVGVRKIAEVAGVSRNTAARRLIDLENLGLISSSTQHGRRAVHFVNQSENGVHAWDTFCPKTSRPVGQGVPRSRYSEGHVQTNSRYIQTNAHAREGVYNTTITPEMRAEFAQRKAQMEAKLRGAA